MTEGEPPRPEPAAQDRTYNGWANYPTWAVHLWLANEETTYHASRGVLADAGDMFQGANDLQEWVEGQNPLAGEAGLYTDILGWALRIVDWEEAARALGPDEWDEAGDVPGRPPERDPNHEEFLRRAAAGELPCPHCQAPLTAEAIQIGGVPEVRLFCREEGCGFSEL